MCVFTISCITTRLVKPVGSLLGHWSTTAVGYNGWREWDRLAAPPYPHIQPPSDVLQLISEQEKLWHHKSNMYTTIIMRRLTKYWTTNRMVGCNVIWSKIQSGIGVHATSWEVIWYVLWGRVPWPFARLINTTINQLRFSQPKRIARWINAAIHRQ